MRESDRFFQVEQKEIGGNMSGSTRELVGSIVDGGKGDVRRWVDSHNYKKLDKARVDMMDRELWDSISVFDLAFDVRLRTMFSDIGRKILF